MRMKKKKVIQIFSDGSLNYNSMNGLNASKSFNFCQRDFKNSKFCDRKEMLLKDVTDHENLKFRHKFLK
jgi:hypothetical protein